MQKIVIFGGTGMSGQCAVNHALSRGFLVRLLIRDESTVPEMFKDKVELVKGNVTNLSDVEAVMKGVGLVCVVLGTRNKLTPTTEMSEGLKNIIAAMKTEGLKKVSVCLSAFLFYEPEKVPKMFVDLNADHQRMWDSLRASSLDYTAVLPPHIADEPSAEFQVLVDKSPGRSISKLDLGKFLIDCLDNEQYSGKSVGLATIKPATT